MATIQMGQTWHDGEVQMHQLLHVPEHDNPTASGMTQQLAHALQAFPLLALGTLDDKEKPWTTLFGGETPLAAPVGPGLMGIRTPVEGKFDPVVNSLFGTASMRNTEKNSLAEDIKRFGEPGKMVSGLSIDLMTRKRVKFAGKAVVGGIKGVEDGTDDEKEVQMVVKIEQSLGNCPKYLNKKMITPVVPSPKLITRSTKLDPMAIKLINKADLFFLSSAHGDEDMDTNHRGGPPGFVRVLSNNTASGAEIIWPEYSGNRLYQTLGNLRTTPKAGLTVPDFETGNVLYMTGETEILIGEDSANVLPRSNLAVKFKVTDAIFVENGLPFRGSSDEPSPYNPAVRLLKSEGATTLAAPGSGKPSNTARLVAKTKLTSTISRYKFSLSNNSSSAAPYKAGQWVALDFAPELNTGYSHMRDDDPGSLNDDFVRTFTVSSAPASDPVSTQSSGKEATAGKLGLGKDEFEITVRRHGPVTAYLNQQNERSGLEIPVLGFGGEFTVQTPQTDAASEKPSVAVFVAGGVGITPLLGHLRDLDITGLRLLWIIKLDDVDFVLDIFKQYPGLASKTSLFLTGAKDKSSTPEAKAKIEEIEAQHANIEARRPLQKDFEFLKTENNVQAWYLCAGQPLTAVITGWLEGENLISESFEY